MPKSLRGSSLRYQSQLEARHRPDAEARANHRPRNQIRRRAHSIRAHRRDAAKRRGKRGSCSSWHLPNRAKRPHSPSALRPSRYQGSRLQAARQDEAWRMRKDRPQGMGSQARRGERSRLPKWVGRSIFRDARARQEVQAGTHAPNALGSGKEKLAAVAHRPFLDKARQAINQRALDLSGTQPAGDQPASRNGEPSNAERSTAIGSLNGARHRRARARPPPRRARSSRSCGWPCAAACASTFRPWCRTPKAAPARRANRYSAMRSSLARPLAVSRAATRRLSPETEERLASPGLGQACQGLGDGRRADAETLGDLTDLEAFLAAEREQKHILAGKQALRGKKRRRPRPHHAGGGRERIRHRGLIMAGEHRIVISAWRRVRVRHLDLRALHSPDFTPRFTPRDLPPRFYPQVPTLIDLSQRAGPILDACRQRTDPIIRGST